MSVEAATRRPARGANVLEEFRRLCQRELARINGGRFPMLRYQKDCVAFVREQLGGEPLTHQVEIMRALASSPDAKVAVRSGQKQGKTRLAIWVAWWFFACFPRARVFMTASTAPQVNRVLWVELKHVAREARQRGLDFGEIPQNPERGVESEDGRSIQGFTTRTIEAMAGLSGANMLFIGDEASAFDAEMAQAIEGNTAGAARVLWISNPTRAEGPFYDAFHTQKRFWITYHLNSEILADRVRRGLEPRVPGIATPETIAMWREKYGEDSPFYLIRVRGDFVLDEQAKIISVHAIMTAQGRWTELAETSGTLSIGIDPAGDSGEGDEYAFSLVRGYKLIALYTFRGLSEEAAIAQALGFLREYRLGDETPNVVIDAEGPIGSSFYGRMRALALHKQIHDPPNAYECYGIKASAPARREPQLYERVRDELWANLSAWFRAGGGIPPDPKLEEELYAPGFLVTVQGKRKVTNKDVIREKLGRSPDRADSLCLATWSPSFWAAEPPEARLPNEERNVGPGAGEESSFDPYSGSNGRGGFSPY